ncbi:hypothetical protein DMUE_2314 [Dictyocoela muelleri]|nr:hypothetical protein DMUE_2314 [Dictyocoela muelleri]
MIYSSNFSTSSNNLDSPVITNSKNNKNELEGKEVGDTSKLVPDCNKEFCSEKSDNVISESYIKEKEYDEFNDSEPKKKDQSDDSYWKRFKKDIFDAFKDGFIEESSSPITQGNDHIKYLERLINDNETTDENTKILSRSVKRTRKRIITDKRLIGNKNKIVTISENIDLKKTKSVKEEDIDGKDSFCYSSVQKNTSKDFEGSYEQPIDNLSYDYQSEIKSNPIVDVNNPPVEQSYKYESEKKENVIPSTSLSQEIEPANKIIKETGSTAKYSKSVKDSKKESDKSNKSEKESDESEKEPTFEEIFKNNKKIVISKKIHRNDGELKNMSDENIGSTEIPSINDKKLDKIDTNKDVVSDYMKEGDTISDKQIVVEAIVYDKKFTEEEIPEKPIIGKNEMVFDEPKKYEMTDSKDKELGEIESLKSKKCKDLLETEKIQLKNVNEEILEKEILNSNQSEVLKSIESNPDKLALPDSSIKAEMEKEDILEPEEKNITEPKKKSLQCPNPKFEIKIIEDYKIDDVEKEDFCNDHEKKLDTDEFVITKDYYSEEEKIDLIKANNDILKSEIKINEPENQTNEMLNFTLKDDNDEIQEDGLKKNKCGLDVQNNEELTGIVGNKPMISGNLSNLNENREKSEDIEVEPEIIKIEKVSEVEKLQDKPELSDDKSRIKIGEDETQNNDMIDVESEKEDSKTRKKYEDYENKSDENEKIGSYLECNKSKNDQQNEDFEKLNDLIKKSSEKLEKDLVEREITGHGKLIGDYTNDKKNKAEEYESKEFERPNIESEISSEPEKQLFESEMPLNEAGKQVFESEKSLNEPEKQLFESEMPLNEPGKQVLESGKSLNEPEKQLIESITPQPELDKEVIKTDGKTFEPEKEIYQSKVSGYDEMLQNEPEKLNIINVEENEGLIDKEQEKHSQKEEKAPLQEEMLGIDSYELNPELFDDYQKPIQETSQEEFSKFESQIVDQTTHDEPSKEQSPQHEPPNEQSPQDDPSKEQSPYDEISKAKSPEYEILYEQGPQNEITKEQGPQDEPSKEQSTQDGQHEPSKEQTPQDEISKEQSPQDEISKEQSHQDEFKDEETIIFNKYNTSFSNIQFERTETLNFGDSPLPHIPDNQNEHDEFVSAQNDQLLTNENVIPDQVKNNYDDLKVDESLPNEKSYEVKCLSEQKSEEFKESIKNKYLDLRNGKDGSERKVLKINGQKDLDIFIYDNSNCTVTIFNNKRTAISICKKHVKDVESFINLGSSQNLKSSSSSSNESLANETSTDSGKNNNCGNSGSYNKEY